MPRPDFELTTRAATTFGAYAQARGVDVQAAAKAHGLPPPPVLGKPGAGELTLPASQLIAFVDELAERVGDPHLGLAVAQATPRGAYGVAEFMIRTAPTLKDACLNFARFSALISPEHFFFFEQDGQAASVQQRSAFGRGASGRHQNEYAAAMFALTIRSLVPTAQFSSVWFINPPPKDDTRLREFFGAPLEFDRETNGVAFPSALLDAPVVSGDPALAAYLESHAVSALHERPQATDLSGRVRQAIREALKDGEPTIERLAVRLRLSGRTLQRRLSDANTTFQLLLDDVRLSLARTYLSDERLDISEIAYLLGYSELRAFDRAFRRWVGVSPGEYRQKRPSP